jgi:hypothetical protein
MRCRLAPLGALLLAGCHGSTHLIGADCLPSGTDVELQAAVDGGGTVFLCPRATFTLAAPLVLRPGLTLRTAGDPTARAEMATVMIGPTFPATARGAVVGSGGAVTLKAVRFDGNRRTIGSRAAFVLVTLGHGNGYHVEGCAFVDAPGWTHLHLLEPCDSSTVVGNAVETAARPHDNASVLTDGLSISCAHTLIEDNQITDISAVGIVYFGGPGSAIRNNTIVEANTSAQSGIDVGDAVVQDHTGVIVEQNRVLAIGDRYLQVGIAAGLHVYSRTASISGVTVRANQIGGIMRYGLAVDGCVDCAVQDNDVGGWHPLPPLAGCPPPAGYQASVANGHAGGLLQPGYADGSIDGCLGPPEVLGDLYRAYAGSGTFPVYLAFEVAVFSGRLEQGTDADALLRAEWDAVYARAAALCPGGAMPDVQATFRRLIELQYGMALPPAEADRRLQAELAATPGSACNP